MRKLLSLTLALLLCAGLSAPALAVGIIDRTDSTVTDVTSSGSAQPSTNVDSDSHANCPGSMANFKIVNTTPVPFTDVPAGHWAAESIALCWKYGLMQGTDAANTTFDPNGYLTHAQAITMACRVHQLYEDGKVTLRNGSPWYTTYFQYAADHDIILGMNQSVSALANRLMSRNDMAHVYSRTLNESEYPVINAVTSVPDMDGYSNSAHSRVLMLYRAGITIGSDPMGNFKPDYAISRAEAAAILIRLILPQQRLRAELLEIVSTTFINDSSALLVPRGAQTITKDWLKQHTDLQHDVIDAMADFLLWTGDLMAVMIEYSKTDAASITQLGSDAHMEQVETYCFTDPHRGQAVTRTMTYGSIPALTTTFRCDLDSDNVDDLGAVVSVVADGWLLHFILQTAGNDDAAQARLCTLVNNILLSGSFPTEKLTLQ